MSFSPLPAIHRPYHECQGRYSTYPYNSSSLTSYTWQAETATQSINQSITFAMAPITGDHWRRTSNLIKSIDKNQ